ncbi:MAG: DUF262 domain-containing protein [Rhizobiaceae bacterium]|nr:DUF262 domain-containing protein [Rhizobiaceae bacterium]
MAELASQPTSVQTIYSWYRDSKLQVNRRYQRKLVWTLEEKQKLIDSLIRKYPIPAVLLAERADSAGIYEIIDGLQRLHSIVSFIEHGFPDAEGKKFNVEDFTTAKLNADKFVIDEKATYINSKDVSTILDYVLPVSIMRNATDSEIADVFDRINTYGHRLSDQERRQAGVETEFSKFVRDISCEIRGDVSQNLVNLFDMPAISINLPKSKHGYAVEAEDVFWVNQGVLRSTDLRDSLDEQCVADIAATAISAEPIDRSKEALDQIYDKTNDESARIEAALGAYGVKKLSDEFKFCIAEIAKITDAAGRKLRSIIFSKNTTNAYPSVFAVIFTAIHELIIKDGLRIADYKGMASSLGNIVDRLETGRKATSPDERRKNIDAVKGLIISRFYKPKTDGIINDIYNDHSVVDIDNIIRRSMVELPNYELKQGIVRLDSKDRTIDNRAIDRIINTICGIANIGPQSSGKIVIGVSDQERHTEKIVEIDNIKPVSVNNRDVVGVYREAKALNISNEAYLKAIRDRISNSKLSDGLKNDVLSNIDMNEYFGLGIIIITVPPQKEVSSVGDEVYFRSGNQTEKASPKSVAEIAKRF